MPPSGYISEILLFYPRSPYPIYLPSHHRIIEYVNVLNKAEDFNTNHLQKAASSSCRPIFCLQCPEITGFLTPFGPEPKVYLGITFHVWIAISLTYDGQWLFITLKCVYILIATASRTGCSECLPPHRPHIRRANKLPSVVAEHDLQHGEAGYSFWDPAVNQKTKVSSKITGLVAESIILKACLLRR